jgi:phosphatidylglycerophosphatase A
VDRLILLIAQGLGTGRSPVAPGTVGTLLGLPLFILLLLPGSFAFFVGSLVVLGVASVWFCGRAETILGLRDPGSVVIDEIVAVPLCFAGWVSSLYFANGSMPEWTYFFSGTIWHRSVVIVLLFRLFDIAKPWPIGPSQAFPGGWGVTIDDLLAALYVNLITLFFLA